MAGLLSGNADGPRSNLVDGTEASRAMIRHSTGTYNDEEFEKIPDTAPVPVLDDGAGSIEVPGAFPRPIFEKAPSAPLYNPDAPAGDSALMSRLYDDAGMDGCWAAAFAGSDSPLLSQSVVETGVTDAPVALAVVLGGLLLAPTVSTERKWNRDQVARGELVRMQQ
jgi:hypothetical protein